MAFSLSRNFWLRGPIWLFNTIFRICRPRAFILDHKKGLFKHFKGVKSPEAATADLIRVVLAEILDFLCIRSWKGRSTHCQWANVSQSMFGIGEWRFWDIWNDFWKRGLSLEDKSVRIDENRLVERWVDNWYAFGRVSFDGLKSGLGCCSDTTSILSLPT